MNGFSILVEYSVLTTYLQISNFKRVNKYLTTMNVVGDILVSQTEKNGLSGDQILVGDRR